MLLKLVDSQKVRKPVCVKEPTSQYDGVLLAFGKLQLVLSCQEHKSI